MILTIAILSGIMWMLYIADGLFQDAPHEGLSMTVYGTILIISSWYLNVVVGIIFLCIVAVITLITWVKVINE